MRLYIDNEKDFLVELVFDYLSKLLTNKKIELIINGNKKVGVVKKVELERDEHTFIVFNFGKKQEKIPVLDETKSRLGKEMISFETKSHTTVIEVQD